MISSQAKDRKRLRLQALTLLAGVTLLGVAMTAGCRGGVDDIATDYGLRQTPRGAGSVNGIGVFADMFVQRGHRVKTWRRLSPRIRDNQVIVWAPDSYSPPDEDAVRFLEQWLNEADGRTLIYIGRDYDAAINYWESVLPGAPPEQAPAIESRLAMSRRKFDDYRAVSADTARWYTVEAKGFRRQAQPLSGEWVDELTRANTGFDPAKAEIELRSHLHPPGSAAAPVLEYEEVLKAGNDVIVSRVTFGEDYEPLPRPSDDSGDDAAAVWPGDEGILYVEDEYYDDYYGYWSDSQIFVVSNGSFLLNLPLVNRQHRMLAGKLIEECETGGRLNVAVLESGPSGVPVYDEEPKPHSYLELLRTYPTNVILLHALGLGLLFCFVFFPIFGRPIERSLKKIEQGTPIYASLASETTGTSDFGKHVEALGEMMERTKEQQYAEARLQHYQQHVKRDSGVGHRTTSA
jgi:hypothetical protein